MTDRIKGLVITFDEDIRTDDAEPLINAIAFIAHVADVKAIVKPQITTYERPHGSRSCPQ